MIHRNKRVTLALRAVRRFVMAAPKKGKQGGIKGLVDKQGPGLYPYLVRSPTHGAVKVQVAVVGRYLQGRWGKHGREHYAFVVHRFPFALDRLFSKYRRRFGIETSYRVLNQGRARTASRSAAFRLLLVGLALLLANLWVYLKWAVVSLPCQGGRVILDAWFSFQRLLFFLAGAIARCYGAVAAIAILQRPTGATAFVRGARPTKPSFRPRGPWRRAIAGSWTLTWRSSLTG